MISVVVLDYVVLVVAASISHTWDLHRKAIWDPGPAWIAVLTGPLLVVVSAEALGVYRQRLTLSALDTLPELITCGWMVTPFMLLLGWHDQHPVSWWIVTAVLTFMMFFFVRVGAFAALRKYRCSDVRHRTRTLIIGGGSVARISAQAAQEHPECGLEPVMIIDGDSKAEDWPGTVTVISRVEGLRRTIVESRIEAVLVAFSNESDRVIVDELRECDELRAEIYVVPRLYEFVHLDRDMDRLHTIPLSRVRRLAFRSVHWRVKRIFSLSVALSALLLLSPLLAVVACIIKLQDPSHPVLFKQVRIGRDGKPFELYKFRSMRPVLAQMSNVDWAPDHAQRVGRFGAFIRKFSIDELPQLWNIVRGDMTLVGPRPERPHFVDKFRESIPAYDARHRVPVGLTGWAAINGLRGDTSIEDRAIFDNFYIENWSLWLDMKILLLTVGEVLFGSGR